MDWVDGWISESCGGFLCVEFCCFGRDGGGCFYGAVGGENTGLMDWGRLVIFGAEAGCDEIGYLAENDIIVNEVKISIKCLKL